MEKTKYINELIESNGFISYLEIGLGDGRNFRNVKCDYKIGIDPEFENSKPIDKDGNCHDIFGFSSDDYFNLKSDDTFDLIFIDGLHHSDQVEKDIVNAWKNLNKGGIILIHDILPHDEAMTIVPRQQRIWTGDVFKAWHGFVTTYPKIKTEIIPETYGLGQIHKSRHKVELGFVSDISFDDYQEWLGN
jgi:SAM-dependent methyltransferase